MSRAWADAYCEADVDSTAVTSSGPPPSVDGQVKARVQRAAKGRPSVERP